MDRDARRTTLLQLLVEAYIETAQPVSSSMLLLRHPQLGLSSATIRASMADLESAGLVLQPHTSAGRIPTEQGLRLYLDQLAPRRLQPRDRSRLQAVAEASDAGDFSQALGQALAALAGQVAVVATPRLVDAHMREINLVRCEAGRLLAILVSPQGLVQQRRIQIDAELEPAELTRVQNFLNARLLGRSLSDVRAGIEAELNDAHACQAAWERRALVIGALVLPAAAEEAQVDVVVEGAARLLDQPEFSDLSRLRAVLCIVEEKEALLTLVARILDTLGVRVMLGSEHRLPKVPDLACVSCTWQAPSGQRTVVGLLGPSRMDYARLMPMVRYATQIYGRYWAQL